MNKKALPSLSYLKDCFEYDPHEGTLTWKARPLSHFESRRGWKLFNTRYANTPAGKPNSKGYLIIGMTVDGHYGIYKAHRIAYAILTGTVPEPSLNILMKNGIKHDIRGGNLMTPD